MTHGGVLAPYLMGHDPHYEEADSYPVMSAKAANGRPALVILIAEDDPNDVVLLKRAFSPGCGG